MWEDKKKDMELSVNSITLPDCVHTWVTGQHGTINNLWGVFHLTYQQTFQVDGRSGISDHVLQLLQPGFHPPLGAERHDCGVGRSKLSQSKKCTRFSNLLRFTCEPSLFLANGRGPSGAALGSQPTQIASTGTAAHNEEKNIPGAERVPANQKLGAGPRLASGSPLS